MPRLLEMIGNLTSQVLSLFTSLTSEEIRANWQAHLQEAMTAGREAAAEKRTELEEELREASEISSSS